MPKNAVVVGAGIVGASVALELARRDWNVRVIDKAEGVGHGSTALSSAVIRCLYNRSEAVALAREGREIWTSWSDYTGLPVTQAHFQSTGVLVLLRETSGGTGGALGMCPEMSSSQIAEQMRLLHKGGVPAEFLKPEALREQFPFLNLSESDVVGIWEPDGGYIDNPVGAVEDLKIAGEDSKVTYWLQSDVREMETEWVDGKRVVRSVVVDTPKETVGLECDVVVNCAGPESARFNFNHQVPLPLTHHPLRQYVTQGVWSNPTSTGYPVLADLLQGFYMRPDRDVFKVGAILPEDHLDFVADADGMADPQAVEAAEQKYMKRLGARVPDAELFDLKTYVGYYDWTVADALPILDGSPVKGYYSAVGTSGSWFKAAPTLGWLMAERIHRNAEDEASTRVRLPKTGVPVDLDFFSSRRRA